MRAAIHQYKLRLTNLSQGNRSLKLGRLSKRKDLDITVAAFANKYSSEEIVARIVAGKSVDLLRSLSARDEKSNLLDRHLNKLYREVTTIYAETGTDDLFLGYPFVEGRFLDGSIARCPLLLFPVRLVRDFQRRPRWRLEVPKEEDVTFNKTFFLAYEKFQEVRLSDDFWDSQLEHFPDIQELLNHLYQFFKDEELQINFNSELFQYKVARFMDKNKALLEKLPAGLLKLQPNAVLGIFPQSDSALLQDYEALESQAGHFKLKEFFQAVPAPSIETYVKEDQRYFVTAVDHSQEEALLRIHHDQSVVVHGPPGTGKSQVILNLIADALARGQKVLVCSQKRAALDVVFHRLHKIGLSRFAVLVHDYRGDRNKIFRQIRKQIDDIDAFREERMDLNLDKWMRDFRLDSRKIDDHNHFFEALYSALTTVGRYGLSPHQLYLLADSQLPLIDLGDHPRQFDYGKMLRFTERLLDLLSYQEFFQKDHPWRQRLSFHSHGFNVRDRLREKLAQLPAEIDALHASAQKIAFLDEPFEEPEEIDAVIVTYSKLVEQLKVPGTAIDFAAYEGQGLKMTSVRSSLAKLERIFKRIASFRILDDFSLLLYHDLAEHFANYEREKDNLGRFFSLSWMRGRWYLKAILSKKDRLFKEEDFKEFKQELEVLHRLMRLYHVLEKDRFFADLPLTDTPERMLAWHGRKVSSLATIKAIREVSLAPPLKPRFRGVDFDAVHWEATVRTLDDLAALSKLLHATFLKWRSWLHNGQIRLLAQGMFQVDAAKSFADALASTFAEAFEDLRGLDNLI
ncbi:MAG TPA: DUF4011 domain-containing protein, partial [Bacteroidetes bacterium]|nr:DUF4011 domain-containing protein [Bacteroidota bacterium]